MNAQTRYIRAVTSSESDLSASVDGIGVIEWNYADDIRAIPQPLLTAWIDYEMNKHRFTTEEV